MATHAGARLIRFLLDANFLMVPGTFKVDIFDQLENFGKDQLYTIDLVVGELEKLTKGTGKFGRHAKVALYLVKKQGVTVLSTADRFSHADDAIRRLAKKHGFTVCTQDKKLIKALKNDKVPVISLRQGRYLERV